MDRDFEDKYRKIEKSYNEYKKVVVQWESAFIKTQGEKPQKADLRQAPKNVRHSYDKYCKYKKVLSSMSEEMRSKGRQFSRSSVDKSLTPTKIFSTKTCSFPKVTITVTPERVNHSSRKMKTAPAKDNKFCFGKNLSKKLFLMQPSSQKKKRSESSQNAAVGDMGKDSLFDKSASCDDKQGAEMVNNSNDSTHSVSENSLEDSSSFLEMDSIKFGESTFGSEEDEDVSRAEDSGQLYTNFLEKYAQPGDSVLSEISYGNEHDSICSLTSLNLSECNGSSCDASTVTSASSVFELSAIAAEVRQCFDILASVGDTAEVEEPYFPTLSSVNRASVAAISTDSHNSKDEIDISVNMLPSSSITGCLPQPPGAPPSAPEVAPKPGRSDKENRKTPSPAKRKFTYAFSPSPEKPAPKKRIFKADRKESSRRTSLNACRPEIPKMTPTVKPAKPLPDYDEVDSDPSAAPPSSSQSPPGSHNSAPVRYAKPGYKKLEAKRRLRSAPNTTKEIPQAETSEKTNEEPLKSIPVIDAFDLEGRSSLGSGKKGKRFPRKQARPQKSINDNFVAIDVSRKVFVRRKKGMSAVKMKRQDWKKKQAGAARDGKIKSFTCRKCGDIGHFARFCTKGNNAADEFVVEVVDDSPFPTLAEAARMTWSKAAVESQSNRTSVYADPESESTENKDDENAVTEEPMPEPSSYTCAFTLVNPNAKTTESYFSEDSGFEDTVEFDLEKALRVFGYEAFRPGQKEAVSRVLKGESTLLMLSTGSGKSLCYQLPAFLYGKKYPGAMTICVSPLVSLMVDQVEGMPAFLNGACLHYNMTDKKKDAVLDNIRQRKVQILLVSPEALCGGLFGLFRNVEELPPISFACIDEVHCVSEWSHNFRPSYLQVCKILREKLNIKTLLGLTATATAQTCAGICEHLQVDPSTIIRGEVIPKNLNLSVSRDTERDVGLVQLLNGERFRDSDSIIIYCTRREECNRISELVRTHVRANPKFSEVTKWRGRSRVSNNCEAYHAGLTAARRATIQKQFMQGSIRIAVATIAFGMGINKADIRSVIHYNMPSTFESYVQEIGRAGRDGLEANCHLFLDSVKGRDISELKRHIYANSVDRVTIRKLIRLIFKPCKCKMIEKLTAESQGRTSTKVSSGPCPGHEVSFSVKQTVEDLDLPEENIETLLCHLAVEKSEKRIEMMPKTYETCKIHSYGGPNLLKTLAQKSPPLAVAVALQKEKKTFKDGDAYLEFNIIETAASMGWNSAVVRREIKSLEWIGSEFNAQGKATKYRKSGLMVEYSELAFRCSAPGDLTDKEFDAVFNSLCHFIAEQERRQLYQLQKVYQSLCGVSTSTVEDARNGFVQESSDSLKEIIDEYFHQDSSGVPALWKPTQQGMEKEECIRREVRSLLLNYKDTKFTGRSVAKIFQGINSPCFPAADWCRNRAFWRRFLDVDFHILSKIAAEEIIMYT